MTRTPSTHYPTLAKRGFVLPGGKQMSAYEGAARGRRLGGWAPSDAGGPNVAGAPSLRTLRTRTRDAIRNNPWAANALQKFASNLVGRGITPRWQLPKSQKGLKAELQQLWADSAPEIDADGVNDVYGQQTLTAKTLMQSGELLIRRRIRPLSDGLAVPIQFQLLEPEFLDEAAHGPMRNGNTRHEGIEINRRGRRVAYWLHKAHPDEFTRGSFETMRIPANEVAHVYRVDRPGQLRGIPWFSAVLARLYILDQYEDAELDRKKTAALFGAFITTTDEDTVGLVGPTGQATEDAAGNPVAHLEPALLQYLRPGEDVKFAEPADAGSNYEVWLKQQLRAIAAGIGITYEQLTGDLRGVNYTSIRAGLLEFRRAARQIINQIMVFQACRWMVNHWLDAAVASGAVSIPDYNENRRKYRRIRWQIDGWDWVDLLKDATANKLLVRSGFESRENIANERGHDLEELDESIAQSNASADERELVLDSDPRWTTNAGLTPAAAANDDDTDPDQAAVDEAEADERAQALEADEE